jgi:anti-anti-sigma factor
MSKVKERRLHPRYETLFPASVLLDDGRQTEGEVLNISKRGLLVMLPPKFRCQTGMLAEVTMHLEVADVPGATFDLASVGKIVRTETIENRLAAGLHFPRDLRLFFDARARRPFAVLDKKMTLSAESTIVQLSGDVGKKQLRKLGSALTELAAQHGGRLILDMRRVTFLDSEAIDLIRKLQQELSDQGGYLKAVRPQLRLAGSMVSDDLAKLAEFRRSLYPTLYHALLA